MPQLTTKSGKEYTYLGWVRKYNAADFPGKMALGREYPGYANRRIHEMDQKSHRKPEEETRKISEDKADRARFRKMPIAELRREYYATLKESLGGPFGPAAKRAHTMIEAELKRRGASAETKPAATRARNEALKMSSDDARGLAERSRKLPPWQYLTLAGKVVTFRPHTKEEAKAWRNSQKPSTKAARFAEQSAREQKVRAHMRVAVTKLPISELEWEASQLVDWQFPSPRPQRADHRLTAIYNEIKRDKKAKRVRRKYPRS